MKQPAQYIRKIISLRCHWIMYLDFNTSSKDNELEENYDFKLSVVTDINDIVSGTYSASLQKKIIQHNPNGCDTFVLKKQKNNDIIGILSVIYKGGNELEYKIRSIDAFLYNVYIKPEYRGNGYIKQMVQMLVVLLKKRGICDLYLAVSTDNKNAITAYQKSGFQIIGKKVFIRFLRHNIPYYSL